MIEPPFVSVIMPVHNETDFIDQSLGAILGQDYPNDYFEIIVADGMSTDGTREKIQAFQKKNPKIQLVANPKKIVATGLNLAIRQSKGEIIIRVDGHCEIATD